MLNVVAGGLLARAAPYIIGILGLAVVATGVVGYVQTARLEASQERVVRVEGERDSALAAMHAVKVESALAAAAAAERLQEELAARSSSEAAFAEYRLTVKGESNACHFVPVDPSIDRLLAPYSQDRNARH